MSPKSIDLSNGNHGLCPNVSDGGMNECVRCAVKRSHRGEPPRRTHAAAAARRTRRHCTRAAPHVAWIGSDRKVKLSAGCALLLTLVQSRKGVLSLLLHAGLCAVPQGARVGHGAMQLPPSATAHARRAGLGRRARHGITALGIAVWNACSGRTPCAAPTRPGLQTARRPPTHTPRLRTARTARAQGVPRKRLLGRALHPGRHAPHARPRNATHARTHPRRLGSARLGSTRARIGTASPIALYYPILPRTKGVPQNRWRE